MSLLDELEEEAKAGWDRAAQAAEDLAYDVPKEFLQENLWDLFRDPSDWHEQNKNRVDDLWWSAENLFDPGYSFDDDLAKGVLLNKESNVAPVPVIYGERKVGGIIVFKGVSGDNKEFLHLVMIVGEGEIQEIGDIYINDLLSTDEKYTGLVTITKYTGTTTQTADADLMASFPSLWTSEHKLTGFAYLVAKLKFDRNAFGRQPIIHAIVKGKKLVDPRAGYPDGYSANPALCIYDYLTNTIYGRGLPTSAIDVEAIKTAANYCDVMQQKHAASALDSGTVSSATSSSLTDNSKFWDSGEFVGDTVKITSGAGAGQAREITTCSVNFLAIAPNWDITPSATDSYIIYSASDTERTFECNAVVDTEKDLLTNLKTLRLTCRAWLPYIQGKYTLVIEKPETSVMSFDEDSIIGDEPFVIISPNKNTRYNKMSIRFINPLANWQDDQAVKTSATYLSDDNNYVLDGEVTLPFETSKSRALYRAETLLKSSRETLTISFQAFMEALELTPGSVITVSQSEPAWVNKYFRVLDVDLLMSGNVNVSAIEYNASVYDRALEPEFLPPPDTTLPDPFYVAAPTDFNADSSESYVINQNGTLITRAKLTWSPSADLYVIYYQIECKESIGSVWSTCGIGSGQEAEEVFVNALKDGVNYDFRISAVNTQNARSEYVYIYGHTVIGKTTPPADVPTFAVSRQSDGTREYSWTYPSPPLDMDHFLVKYVAGTGGAWSGMSSVPGMEEIPKGMRRWENNQLAAGTYTFGIKAVDSSDNESTNAKLVEVTLGSPRLGAALNSEDAAALGWPGSLTQARLEDNNLIYAENQDDWTGLPTTWDAWVSWIENPYLSGVMYTHQVQDAGSSATVLPQVLYTTNATTITVEERHGNTATPDGSWSAWAAIASSYTARYTQTRITLQVSSGLIELSAYRSTIYQA